MVLPLRFNFAIFLSISQNLVFLGYHHIHATQLRSLADNLFLLNHENVHEGEAEDPARVKLLKTPEKPWQMAEFRAANVMHTLRVCNAYPYEKPLRILLNEVELYGGMAYKECDDFANLRMVAGDQLRFLTEVDHHEKTAGIFSIGQVPKKSSTTMLLIVQRNDAVSNSVKFESHMFRSEEAAQIAVIDTVRGEPKTVTNQSVSIEHRGSEVVHSVPESLPYGSVHRINSGLYNVVLKGKKKELVALPTHDYVVMRVGIIDPPEDGEAAEPIPGDKTYKDELVVFPKSDESRLQSGSVYGKSLTSILVIFVVFIGCGM